MSFLNPMDHSSQTMLYFDPYAVQLLSVERVSTDKEQGQVKEIDPDMMYYVKIQFLQTPMYSQKMLGRDVLQMLETIKSKQPFIVGKQKMKEIQLDPQKIMELVKEDLKQKEEATTVSLNLSLKEAQKLSNKARFNRAMDVDDMGAIPVGKDLAPVDDSQEFKEMDFFLDQYVSYYKQVIETYIEDSTRPKSLFVQGVYETLFLELSYAKNNMECLNMIANTYDFCVKNKVFFPLLVVNQLGYIFQYNKLNCFEPMQLPEGHYFISEKIETSVNNPFHPAVCVPAYRNTDTKRIDFIKYKISAIKETHFAHEFLSRYMAKQEDQADLADQLLENGFIVDGVFSHMISPVTFSDHCFLIYEKQGKVHIVMMLWNGLFSVEKTYGNLMNAVQHLHSAIAGVVNQSKFIEDKSKKFDIGTVAKFIEATKVEMDRKDQRKAVAYNHERGTSKNLMAYNCKPTIPYKAPFDLDRESILYFAPVNMLNNFEFKKLTVYDENIIEKTTKIELNKDDMYCFYSILEESEADPAKKKIKRALIEELLENIYKKVITTSCSFEVCIFDFPVGKDNTPNKTTAVKV